MRGRLVALGLLTVGLSLSLLATRARADFQVIQYEDPANQAASNQNLVIASTPTNWGPGAPKTLINDPFVIQQFDPTAHTEVINGKVVDATLYEVVVSLKYEFDNTIQMSFVKASTSTVTAQGMMQLDLNNSLGHLATANIVNTPTFFTSNTTNFPKDVQTANVIFPTKVIASTSAMGYFDASTLNTFTGSGALTMPIVATASSGYTNSAGNGAGGSATTASAALSVTD